MATVRGFSLFEMVIVLAIGAVLLAFVASGTGSARREKEASIIADTIVFTLEEAKANAVSGKYGSHHGVAFEEHSYTLFAGSSFSEEGIHNRSFEVNPRYEISTTFPEPAQAVIFTRGTGVANAGTITVTDTEDELLTRTITIGAGGDITVLE